MRKMKPISLAAYKQSMKYTEITISNPEIIDLFSYKVYGGPHKCCYGIIYRNPRCPKRDTLYVTDGSPMVLR